MNLFKDKRILITGGTGSLGRTLIRRLLSGQYGLPAKIVVFSRDEAKQDQMRLEYQNHLSKILSYKIGDVRDCERVSSVLRDIDIVFHAAALKQVPTCEYFPMEAVATNIQGAANIVRAIDERGLPVETVVGISTDKAVKPVNVMGMTKSIQERIFVEANLTVQDTRFIVVRYGNVLASRGSVIPLFHHQIKQGGPVTITDMQMTRFLMSLDDAVSVIFEAVQHAKPGETYVPRPASALIIDVAQSLIGENDINIRVIGIRPGEKLHETLISEEEGFRTFVRDKYYVIDAALPELRSSDDEDNFIRKEFSSTDNLMTLQQVKRLLVQNNLMIRKSEKNIVKPLVVNV